MMVTDVGCDECWATIIGFHGYQVSDRGRVRSWLKPRGNGQLRESPRPLKPWKVGRGYLMVGLWNGNRKRTSRYVHHLVLEAFVGPMSPGMEACHGPGGTTDNSLDNLRWGTHQENMDDVYDWGRGSRWVAAVTRETELFTDDFIPVEALIPEECWRDVVGFYGYQCSSFGKIRSRYRKGSSYPRFPWAELSISRGQRKYGRDSIKLYRDKKQFTFRVYRLILETFSGPERSGMECRHIDGNHRNNKISNLRWSGRLENNRDRLTHGTDNRGSRCGTAKLNEESARQIRLRRLAGESGVSLAREFNVHPSTVTDIHKGRKWAHVLV